MRSHVTRILATTFVVAATLAVVTGTRQAAVADSTTDPYTVTFNMSWDGTAPDRDGNPVASSGAAHGVVHLTPWTKGGDLIAKNDTAELMSYDTFKDPAYYVSENCSFAGLVNGYTGAAHLYAPKPGASRYDVLLSPSGTGGDKIPQGGFEMGAEKYACKGGSQFQTIGPDLWNCIAKDVQPPSESARGAYHFSLHMGETRTFTGQLAPGEPCGSAWSGTHRMTITLQGNGGDLKPLEVRAVQAPLEYDRLVAGKKAAIRARIENTFDSARVVDIRVKIDTAEGGTFERTVHDVVLPAGESVHYLPTDGTPPRLAATDALKAEVEVDENNAVGEAKEDNNTLAARDVPVIDNHGITLRYRRLGFTVTSSGLSQTSRIEEGTLSEAVATVEGFFDDVYPIDPREGTHIAEPSVNENLRLPTTDDGGSRKLTNDEFDIELAKLELAARISTSGATYVYLTKPGAITQFTDRKALGIAWPGTVSTSKAVIAVTDNEVDSTVAHEVGHALGVSHDDSTADGYRVTSFAEVSRPEFMSTSGGAGTYWIGRRPWEQLLTRLSSPAADPDLFVIAGTVRTDGSVVVQPLWQTVGIVDRPLDAPGAITVEMFGNDGALLGRTGVDPEPVGARAIPGQSDVTESGPSNFALRIPRPAGVARLVVRRANDVLYDKTRTAPPTVEMHVPDGLSHALGDTVPVSWTVADPDGEPVTSALQVSSDGGVTFEHVGAPGPDTSHTLTISSDLAGKPLLWRVLATDGFSTTEAHPTEVVPAAAPTTTVVAPTPVVSASSPPTTTGLRPQPAGVLSRTGADSGVVARVGAAFLLVGAAFWNFGRRRHPLA